FIARLDVPTSNDIRTIESSATKTFQRSTKTEIAAIKLWRYDSLQAAPKGHTQWTSSIGLQRSKIWRTPSASPKKRAMSCACAMAGDRHRRHLQSHFRNSVSRRTPT